MSTPLLSLNDVTKSFPSFTLAPVQLDLAPGEVHALVGENGAGKSTLSHLIAGLLRPDGGHMLLRGETYAPSSRKVAEQRGVRMVMQELNLVGSLTVAESLFVDQLPNRWGWIDYRHLDHQAREVLAQVGLGDLDPTRLIRTLGIGQQQLVEIAAGLSRRCDVLLLDEPTAALTDPEIERLFEQIAQLKARGVGVLYISHRMEEIRRVADRITILRDGRLVTTCPTPTITLAEIVKLMVGRDIGETVPHTPSRPGPVALRVRGLSRGTAVRGVSFEVHQGEVLGFAGLMGSGRTETMRLIFGADRADRGEVFLHDAPAPVRFRSPRDAVRAGIALLTEDRKQQGLFLPWSIRANVTLTRFAGLTRFGGWIQSVAESLLATQWVETLRIRCHSAEQRVNELSGGNQQKVVLARWLYRDSNILIFDEPTRGIDVGAKFELYQLLRRLAERGKALIVVSSDLKELMALCDRLVVMSAGRIAATFGRGEWSKDRIMAAALSGHLGSEM